MFGVRRVICDVERVYPVHAGKWRLAVFLNTTDIQTVSGGLGAEIIWGRGFFK